MTGMERTATAITDIAISSLSFTGYYTLNRRLYGLHFPIHPGERSASSWYKNTVVHPSKWFDACTRSLK